MKTIFKTYLTDIRFWIIVSVIIRMFGIINPPLEMAHNWRQCDMLMVSKNISTDFSQILYPHVDYGGAKPQVVGMEFPFMNFLIALMNKCFGYTHWYGRLLNLIVSSLGVYAFYRFIKKTSDEKHAFYSALVLLFSLWFAYSRKIMPDTFSASLCIVGCYCTTLFFETDKKTIRALLLAFLLFGLSFLTKISSLVLLVLLLPVLYKHKCKKVKIALFAFMITLCVAIVFYWYFVWVPYLNTLSDVRFFMGTSLSVALKEIGLKWNEFLLRFYETSLGYLGFIMFCVGLYFMYRRNKVFIVLFCLAFVVELLFVLKAGDHFAFHTYYILPFVPHMALVAGYALTIIKPKYAAILVFAMFVENFCRYYGEFIIKPRYKSYETISLKLDSLGVKQSDAIAINSTLNPTPLYFSGRCGWAPENGQLSSIDFVNELAKKQCKYVLIDKKVFGSDITLPVGRQIYDDEYFRLYKLNMGE